VSAAQTQLVMIDAICAPIERRRLKKVPLLQLTRLERVRHNLLPGKYVQAKEFSLSR
jgi:hypothetical protein